jgi:uncharacterized delta-60 repeat protein
MKKIKYLSALLGIILTLLTFHISFSQVNQEWVTRYNGPIDSTDYANAIASDDSGNVYVTGQSYGSGTSTDYVTIKYNSAGIQKWVARYNGPGNSYDMASSIAVDDLGNIYVTGGSYGVGTEYDWVTIKYNSTGDQQWVARYNGPGNSYDIAWSIALDNLGNIYVSGGSSGNETGSDFTTIKYSTTGAEQWVNRYNGPGNTGDQGYSITLDNSGNIYATGYSNNGSGANEDYTTIKYNSAGDSEWIARYNGLGNGRDEAISIAVDGSANVYVTGRSFGGSTDYDYATIKYNSSGVQLWIQRYNGPGNDYDIAYKIILFDPDNVYVTGYSTGSGTNEDYTTIKYNSAGIQQWVAGYNGPGNSYDGASSIAVDITGNVYVTGVSEVMPTYSDYTTIKYNPEGIQQWVQRYNGQGNSDGGATSIAVDSSGNVYVTGYSEGSGTGYDFATIKYSQSTVIRQIYSNIPEQFSLYQNYPNPFNPVTNLEFGISDLGFVSLKVYDILGKEIIKLVNEKLSPGKYKVTFDGSGLPSGVYFYRLSAGDFTETKRMMLVK